jgi:alanyl-tRNA synthetase
MASERLYYDDSYTTRFRARIAEKGAHAGKPAVELESSFFYPESGGQLGDHGTLGAARVVDVQTEDGGRVWHLIEGDPGAADVEAEVDWARRFDHMQQHTGQHLLSAGFERVLDVATLSCHLGEERNTIELAMAETDWSTLSRVEEAANRVIWENRPIRLHWTDDQGVSRFALRKPPKVTGRIRIVDIADWDLSACGGTHTRHTGEVGAIKIVRWEKVRGNVRVEFLCGSRSLADHAWRTEALLEGARRRTMKDRDLLAHLEKAAEERDLLRKRLDELTESLLTAEARERSGDPPCGVADLAASRPRDDVRKLALKCLEVGSPWAVIAAAGPDPVLVVARRKGEGLDLRPLADELRKISGGKGGGGADYLQLTAADADSLRAAYERARRAFET